MTRLSLIVCVAFYAIVACKPERQAAEASPATSASASASAAPKAAKVESVRARRHLPRGCDVALEVDVQELFANDRLGPQLLASVVPPKDPKLREQVMAHPDQASFLRFLEAAKIDPQKDLKSVAFCVPEDKHASESRFVAIIAGEFPGGLVELMQEHAPPGKTYTLESLGTEKALFREGKWMSQGAGNVVLFGNDKDLIIAAQKRSEAHEEYTLADRVDVALTVNESVLASMQGPEQDPVVAMLRRGKRAQLQIDLSSGELKGKITLPDAASVGQFQEAIKTLLSQMKAQGTKAPPQVRQMMQPTIDVLEKAQFTGEGETLRLALQLPPGMLEAALQQMAMVSLGAGGLGGPASATAGAPARAQVAALTRTPPRQAPRSRATEKHGKRPSQRPQASAPMLPQLPSFQLTPPSALRNNSTPAVPPAQVKARASDP